MSYRSSTLLPYNEGIRFSSPQYDPIERQRSSGYSASQEQDEYELGRFRSYSSGQYLLTESLSDDHDRKRPGSTASSVKGFATSGSGLWNNQMLVDRSLRSMAVLTTVFALVMMLLVFICLKSFIHRLRTTSTSVFANVESCDGAGWKIAAAHLVINIAATMVLGMSNTYQQLVTALDANDIRPMLQKYGDSKVGTNSPFAINRKMTGKTKAWLSWILLISTSLPIHLLANSVIGLSYSFGPPKIEFQKNSTRLGNATGDFSCWSVFRTESYWWPSSTPPQAGQAFPLFQDDSSYYNYYDSYTYQAMTTDKLVVSYNENVCANLRGTASSLASMVSEFNRTGANDGTCVNGVNVACDWTSTGEPVACRISVRMQAALTLAAALLIKASYMIIWNIRLRGHLKTKCLTFGDVLAASALNPQLQVSNECLVNSNEAYRKHVDHTCHKHCKSNTISATGDELGHCQKCKKYNKNNLAAGLEHPIVATKYKKSLISNLGFTAVTQMILLMFCCFAMLGVSLTIALFSGQAQDDFKAQCRYQNTDGTTLIFNKAGYDDCMKGAKANWQHVSGGWGGFNESISLAALPPDELLSETAAFAIANGAQLIYSLLYLLLVYNLTLISMEHDWGSFESSRKKLRCTLYKGRGFSQSYLLQLPKRVLFPLMGFSAMMHWLLGQAIATKEWVWFNPGNSQFHVLGNDSSQYEVVYAAYPVWLSTLLMLLMTSICWWAFSYAREGYIPQMYGSIRVLCASTTHLRSFPSEGIQWGDLGDPKKYRHAGFTEDEPGRVAPGELYCGDGDGRLIDKGEGEEKMSGTESWKSR